MRLFTFACAASLFAAGMAQAQQGQAASAELKNAKGEVVGKLRIAPVRKGEGVRVTGMVKNLPPGDHGFHIHMTGKCDPPDFTSAGGHFNPAKSQHSLHDKGGHAGDLGNITVAADGTAKINMRVGQVTLGEGPNSLFKPDGTAVVIHANPDDLKTDPTGNAGGRIACGVIMK